MFTYEGLHENFQFLILEIKKQVEETVSALENPDDLEYHIEKVTHSGDYVDNLKNIIGRKSYSQILTAREEEKHLIDNMMAINTIASNLEKVGDYCENIVKQVAYFKDSSFMDRYNYIAYISLILDTLDMVTGSLFNGDIQQALIICKAEYKIDILYEADFQSIMEELKHGTSHHGDLVTAMNIFRYLERAGDALLNSGEAIISSVMGTRIKINQYLALAESVDPENNDDLFLETIGVETRSGCRIEKLKSTNSDNDWEEVIYKEGRLKKIEEERENLQKWNDLFPELVPSIFGYEVHGTSGTILLEFLHGKNFQEIIMSQDLPLVTKALERIMGTVSYIWEKTMTSEPSNSYFVKQLEKRLDDVYRVHPYFREETKFIGSMEKPSLERLIQGIKEIEEELSSPFSVMSHGDFNNDNIIYNITADEIYFIDIHRSDLSDYAQDSSVFLVSNFRLPILDSTPRKTINIVVETFFKFVKGFAQTHGDETFQARLALGLCRSYLTSTRFALRKEFAKSMYFRAVFLMERLLAHRGKPWQDYTLPLDVVKY